MYRPRLPERANSVSVENGEYRLSKTTSTSWCDGRVVANAEMSGWFAVPAHHETLPTLAVGTKIPQHRLLVSRAVTYRNPGGVDP